MSKLDTIIEHRLVVKDKRYRLKKMAKVFTILFIVLMGLLFYVLYSYTQVDDCKTLSHMDILEARQLYYAGEIETEDLERFLIMYFEGYCA